MLEKWKPIYDGNYAVSNFGKVERIKGGQGAQVGRLLKLRVTRKGYLEAALRVGGKQLFRTVHILVAANFIGPRPAGKEVNHKDGNKKYNYYKNLEYVTSKENNNHAVKMGLWKPNFGSNNGASKLTSLKVKKIRELYSSKKNSQVELGKIFGVSQAIISSVILRKIWKRV